MLPSRSQRGVVWCAPGVPAAARTIGVAGSVRGIDKHAIGVAGSVRGIDKHAIGVAGSVRGIDKHAIEAGRQAGRVGVCYAD